MCRCRCLEKGASSDALDNCGLLDLTLFLRCLISVLPDFVHVAERGKVSPTLSIRGLQCHVAPTKSGSSIGEVRCLPVNDGVSWRAKLSERPRLQREIVGSLRSDGNRTRPMTSGSTSRRSRLLPQSACWLPRRPTSFRQGQSSALAGHSNKNNKPFTYLVGSSKPP